MKVSKPNRKECFNKMYDTDDATKIALDNTFFTMRMKAIVEQTGA